MRYNNYEQRVDKMVKAKKFILRHLVLIVCLSILAVATVVCLCSIKGTVIEGDAPLSFEYGQDFEYDASAVFNSVTYQFKAEGSDEWTSEVPKEAGEYSVRAVSNGLFGDVRYGEVKTFTISPKSLDVTIKEDSVTYGENPTLQADLAKGDVIECSEFDFADFTKETTTVKPDSESLVIRNSDGKDVTSSYKINIVEKSIKFTKRAIEIVISGDEKVYFAGNLAIRAYEINEEKGTLAYGDNVSMDFSKSIIDVGEIENTPENFHITNAQGQIVTDRYEVTKVVGTLKITKRHLIIYPSGASKVYDGTPLSCAAYDQDRIEGDGLAGNDYISQVTALNSITTVAESESENKEVNHNQIDIRICDPNRKDADGKDLDVTHDYNIIYFRDDSKLTITPRPITITAKNDTKTYDGKPLTRNNNEDITYTQNEENEGLVCGRISLTITGSQTSAGVSKNVIDYDSIIIYDDNEVDVTANYDITTVDGTLTVDKRKITIVSGSASFVYNGENQFYDEFDVTGDGIADGQIPNVVKYTTIQNVNESGKNNILEIKIFDGDDEVTENYEITYPEDEQGTLEVTPRPISIESKSASFVYNGENQFYDEFNVAGDGIADGQIPRVVKNTTIQNVSESGKDNVLEIKIFDGDTDVSDNYTIDYSAYGTLEVTPRPIIVTANSAQKVYDGTELKDSGFSVDPFNEEKDTGIVEGHEVFATVVGSITIVGRCDNVVTVDSVTDADGSDMWHNYDIHTQNGTLTITKRPVIIRSLGDEKVYDDAALEKKELYIEAFDTQNGRGIVSGHTVAATFTSSLTDVGTIDNEITDVIVKDASGKDVTQNYEIKCEYGKLKVTPRPITLTANSKERMYDGTPLVDGGVSADPFNEENGTGIVDGHVVTATVKGSITDVGSKDNFIVKESVVITSGERDVTYNYDITTQKGTLTVTHRPIVVVSLSQTFVYNGKAQVYEEFDVTEGEGIEDGKGSIINGQIPRVVNNTPIQNVNESGKDNVLKISIFDGDTDVTDNYTIDYRSYGKLTVTKRPITVTANSKERMYDGTPLFDGGYYANAFDEDNHVGLVVGHEVFATVEGSITDVGSKDNIIVEGSVVVKNGDDDVTPNYEITTLGGTLTVTVRPIRVQTATASFVYDGEEHYSADFEVVSEIKVADNQTADVTAKPSVQNVWDGTVKNELTVVIYDKDGVDVSKNYEITYEYGDINVTPRKIKITAGSLSKVYDDEPLACSDYEVESTDGDRGLAPSQRAEASVVKLSVITYTPTPQPNRIDPASVVIYDKYGQSTIGEYSVKENYAIEFVDGELIVNKRPITVTGKDATKIYDATGLFNNEFTYTEYGKDEGLLENRGHKIAITKFAALTDAGEIENVITVNITVVRQNGYEENVTNNYKITYVYGKLKVTPRPITVKTDTKSFVYNGKEQFCEDYTVTAGEGIEGQDPIANGQEARVVSNTKIQNVSESGKDNVLEIKIFDFGGNEINLKNYAITYEYGTLSVTPRPIAVKLTDREKVYDALPFVTDQVEVISLESTMPIVDGHYVQIDPVGDDIVDAETYKVGFTTAYVFDANGSAVTDNYAITMVEGTLTILKRKVTVTAGSASKVYDGKALWCKDVTIEKQNGDRGILVGLHSASAKVNEFSVTDWSDTIRYNTIDEASFHVTAADGNPVTSNYEPQFIDGELTIYKRHITVTALGGEKVYDDSPLTNDKYEVETALGERGLLTDLGHKLCDMVTNGTITSKGSVQNTFANEAIITDADDNDITYNYQVEYVYEDLFVTPRPITVTSKSATKIYDATELFNKDFDYTPFGVGIGLIDGHEIKADTWTELTNAGSTKNEITVKITVVRKNGDVDDVTENYKIEYTYGTLTVTHRPIVVQSKSQTFVYNGKDQVYEEFDVTEGEGITDGKGSIINGQISRVVNNTPIQNVWDGKITNKLTIKVYDGDEDVTDNYDISYPEGKQGTLEVTPRPITVTAVSRQRMYDGTPLFDTDYIVNAFDEDNHVGLVVGHVVKATVVGSITIVGHCDNVVTVDSITDADGNDMWDNYDITTIDGTLEVTHRKITVQTATANFVYDGEPHYCEDFDVISDTKVVEWQKAVVVDNPSVRNVWEDVDNALTIKIYDGDDDVTEYYEIVFTCGKLIVNKRRITITSGSAKKVYDDEFLSCDQVTFEETDGDRGLAPLQSAKASVVGVSVINYTETPVINGIDPTSVVISDKNKQSTVDGHAVKENYDITFNHGTLEITKRPIRIISGTKSRVYDGTEFKYPNTTSTVASEGGTTGLLKGKNHTIVVVKAASLIDVGTTPNEIVVNIIAERDSGKLDDVTKNYKIEYNYGTLTVTPRPIVVESESAVFVYNGQDQFCDNFKVTGEYAIVEGQEARIVIHTPVQNVMPDPVRNVLEIEIWANGKNVTGNYEITYPQEKQGTLEVTPRPITVTANSAQKVYDGTELKDSGFSVDPFNEEKGTGIVAGHEVFATVVGSITDFGTTLNTFDGIVTVKNGDDDVINNYSITLKNGTLTITKRPVIIRSLGAEKVYDDAALEKKELDVEKFDTQNGRGIVNGHTATATFISSLTDADTIDNVITDVIVKDASGNDVTQNYEIKCEYGKLVVTPRPITVMSKDATKVYDATPLSNKEIDYTPFGENIGLLENKGHKITITEFAELTDANEIENKILVAIKRGDTDVTKNYDITYVYGTLEVTKRPITVVSESKEFEYDGKEQFWDGFEETNVVEGQKAVVKTHTTLKNIGKKDNKLTVNILDKDGKTDVTGNYAIDYPSYGTLEVIQRSITVKPADVEKVYDGKAFASTAVEITYGSLAEGHAFDCDPMGTIVSVGSETISIDKAKFRILDENGLNATDNYNITYQGTGTLTITKRPITVTACSAETVGDETTVLERKAFRYTEFDENKHVGLVPWHDITATVEGRQEGIGSSQNVVSNVKIYDINDNGREVTGNYAITLKNGTLKVIKEGDDSSDNVVLDESADLRKNDDSQNEDPKVVMSVKSGVSDRIYLKLKSYGDFNGKGWSSATAYDSTIGDIYGFDYLTGSALSGAGYTAYDIAIRSNISQYLLPYYMAMTDGNYKVQTSDVAYVGNGFDDYSLQYYVAYAKQIIALKGSIEGSAEEQAYRAFVKNNYTTVPDDLKDYLNGIIAEQGFDADSLDVYMAVANYVKKSAKYNLNYDSNLDSATNIIYAFLNKYKEGVCRHFASAATLIFRQLGIPARYTTGLTGRTQANEWTDITTNGSHAWVEVYVDGVGWVQLEVTPGGAGNGNGNEESDGDGERFDGSNLTPDQRILDITPITVSKIHDGTPLYAENDIIVTENIARLLKLGYRYVVEVTGSQTDVGIGKSTITKFVLFDPNGANVTENGIFTINLCKGDIIVYDKKIGIHLGELKKIYDGQPFDISQYDGFTFDNLPEDYTVDFEIEPLVDAGVYTAYSIKIKSYTVYDVNGNKVEGSLIEIVDGSITILQRNITVESKNYTKVYDGTPLKNESEVTVENQNGNRGLLHGHVLSAKTLSELTNVGSTSNAVTDIAIFDEQGNDVTDNYAISITEGTLTVTKRNVYVTTADAEKFYDGTPLTKELYTVKPFDAENQSGFVLDHKFDVLQVIGSQTDAGQALNEINYNTISIKDGAGNDVTSNYSVVCTPGTLNVLPRRITITTADASKVYDGTPLQCGDYTISDDGQEGAGLATGQKIGSVEIVGSIIGVGYAKNTVGKLTIVDADGNEVNRDNYIVTYHEGTLEVTPRPIWVKSASDSKVYDGTALSNDGYTYERFNASGSGLANGHEIEVIITVSIIDACTISNTIDDVFVKDSNGKPVTANYEINKIAGELEVTKRPIKITTASATKVYDGTPLVKKDGYSVEKSNTANTCGLVGGHTYELNFTAEAINYGVVENAVSVTIFDANGNDVTHNYDYLSDLEFGLLEITQRPIWFESGSASKVYDAVAIRCDVFDYEKFNASTESGLLDGHHVFYMLDSSITDAGSVNNSITDYSIRTDSGEDVTYNYSISLREGTLTVTPRPIWVKSASDSKVYDGTVLSNGDFDYERFDKAGERGLLTIHDIKVVITKSIINAGSVENSIDSILITDVDGKLVNDNYSISIELGTLTVKQIELEIVTEGAEKFYDGTPLTHEKYNYTFLNAPGFVADHRLDGIRFTGTQKIAGSSPNTIAEDEVRVRDGAGGDVTENYNIMYRYGELIVNQRPIGIIPDGASKVYDGTPLTNQTYKVSDCDYGKDGGLAPIQYIARIRFIGERTEVGTAYARLDVDYLAIYDQNGNDTTRNYVVSTEDGTLEVMPIELEIVTEGAEKVYDGTPLTNERYNYSFLNALGFVADHRLDGIRFTGLQTDAYSSLNTIAEDEVKILDGAGNDVTKNYRISYQYGELIVTPRPITIITDSASKVYDGTPLSKGKYTVEHSDGETPRGLLEGHTLTLSLNTVLIGVDRKDNVVTDLRIVDANGNDVTDNYAPEYQFGTLEITPRPVWISSGTSEKVYDGTPLKNGAIESESCNSDNTRGLVSGHRFDVALNKSITDVGSIPNEFDHVIIKDADGNDVTRNYDIIPIEGTLTVYPIELMIVTEGAEKFYDGTPLTNDKYKIFFLNATDFVEGHYIVVQVIGSQTIVGSSPNAIDESGVKIFDGAGGDVTKNYNITYRYGELIVNKRPIGINPNGAEKIYDGTPLTNPDDAYTISDCGYGDNGGLAPDQHIASVWFDGERIPVGTSPTTLNFESLSICDQDGNDVTENYNVTSVPGTLTVKPRKLQIVVDDASKEYDGTPLEPTPGGFTVTEDENGGLVPGQNISEIELGGEQLKPGSSPSTVIPGSIKITDGSGADVTGNYDIEIVDGTLTVERAGGLDTSGGIGGGQPGPGEFGDDIQVVLHVKSETSGSIYLKIKSFGNYDGKGWSDAVEYGKTLVESFGFDYLTGSALKKAGIKDYGIEIRSETMQYFLPYYLSMADGSYDIQSSDVEYFGDPLETYSLKYYSAFVSQISTLSGVKDACVYTEQEAAYRDFVYKNYLGVPTDTKEYLQKLIDKNKKTFTTGNIYEAVANFIQNAAEYDLDYDRAMDEEKDIVLAFLRDYKKGVCRHYASAATLLFRTLGIPARYSIGYVGQTDANEWIDITNQQGHAWVEVYIDGVGWAQVEVTGGGPGSGNGNGNGSGFGGSGNIGEGELEDKDPKDVTIQVKPARIGKAYDGTPLYAQNTIERNDILQMLLSKGYSYRVKVEGSQTDVGIGTSRITEFKLLDPNGNDVTEGNGFIIVRNEGEIVIKEKHVRVFLYPISKTYDGKPLSFEANGMKLYYFVDIKNEQIKDDITIDFTLKPVVNAGVYKAEDIGLESYTVRDANGNDVTANYYVDTTGGTCTIKKRTIDITAGSATKGYDGKELTNDSYHLSGKGLVEGDVLEVLIEGSITDVGSIANVVKGVRITDADGNNVSDNYQITGKWGTLTVTKPKN